MKIERKKIITSLIWKFAERFSVQGISFIVTIVLARILAPKEYGQIALLMVFVNIANVIIDGGFNTALIQKKDAKEVDFSTIFHVSMGCSSIIYIVLFFAAPYISKFYNQPELALTLRILGLSLFMYAVNSIQRAYISRNMLFKKLFKSSLISIIGSGSIGIILAINGYGIWALVFHYLSSAFLLMSAMFITVKWYPSLCFSKNSFNSLFSFGWKILCSNFIISIFVNIRSLIIGKMYTSASLAYFDKGKQLPALIMENINASIQTVLFPAFSAEQEDITKIKSMVSRSVKTSCYIIFPLMIMLFVTARPLIELLLTNKWDMAVPFVQIFSIAYLLMPIQIANLEAIKSLGKSDTILKLEISKKVLEITLLITTALISVYAIAIGVVIYNFICIFINVYPSKRYFNYALSKQVKDILPELIISLLMGFVCYSILWIELPPYTTIFFQIIIGCLIYISLSRLFKLECFNYIVDIIKNLK